MRRIIYTSYLTSSEDPQRKVRTQPDDPARLMLKEGCERLKIPCYVFYDELSDDFVKNNTSKYFMFIKSLPRPDLSVNDARFFMYRDYLKYIHKDAEQVWLSDLFDVKMNLDPCILPKHEFYCGIHNDWVISDKGGMDGKYVHALIKNIYIEVPNWCEDKPILMAGTWGGNYFTCLSFLQEFCEEIERTTEEGFTNVNLPVFNVLAHKRKYYGGFPLNSKFRHYDYSAPVVFVHK